MKQYSVAEVCDAFVGIVCLVESEGPVLLTCDGRAVAVLLSAAEYGHLVNRPISFGQAYDEFRKAHDLTALAIEPSIFYVERDHAPERDVPL